MWCKAWAEYVLLYAALCMMVSWWPTTCDCRRFNNITRHTFCILFFPMFVFRPWYWVKRLPRLHILIMCYLMLNCLCLNNAEFIFLRVLVTFIIIRFLFVKTHTYYKTSICVDFMLHCISIRYFVMGFFSRKLVYRFALLIVFISPP